MKFVHPDDTSAAKGNKDYVKLKTEPAIRFAEILLIYAEALNELEDGSSYDIPSWDGSASYSVKRDINEMKKRYSSCSLPCRGSRLYIARVSRPECIP